jgi:hypothetical protein
MLPSSLGTEDGHTGQGGASEEAPSSRGGEGRPVRVAERVLLDLAHGVARQAVG